MRALLIASTFAAAFMASAGVDHLGAQYINGPAPPVSASQFCAEFRGWVGMSRAGHTLRSVQCSGGGHEFTVHVRID